MLIMSSLNEKLHIKLNVSKYRDLAPFPIEGKGLGFGVCDFVLKKFIVSIQVHPVN